MELKYYKELDGLRGLAALMIMFFHFMPNGDAATHPVIYDLHKIVVFGQTGVTLFFVLSGFLITRILLLTKSSRLFFRNFYIKRALRIFPLYYLALAVFYFIVPLLVGAGAGSHRGNWMYWVYLQNIADTFNWPSYGPQHFWSLAVEEHFYLFWPLVVYFISLKGLRRFIAAIVCVALVCRCLLIHYGYGTFYFTFSVMDGLAIGSFLSWLEVKNKLSAINFDLIIIISFLLMLPAWLITGGRGYDWMQVVKFPVIAIFYMGIIGKVISGKSWLNTAFALKGLRFTGKISYGLYVFHPLCFMLFYHYFTGHNTWVNALLCLIFSYLVATVSFYAYEVHFIKLKKHFEPGAWRKKQELQFK